MNALGIRRYCLQPRARLPSACLRHSSPSPLRAFHDDAAENTLSKRLNPPASTRPPILESPARNPEEPRVQHLIKVGKAYLSFYKNGFKAVFSNRRMLRDMLAQLPQEVRPSLLWPKESHLRSFSRADYVTFWRVRHDVMRIPLFGLILVVCGEFTPFIVMVFEGAVPYTCRIPGQIFRSLSKAETRRSEAFEDLEARFPQGPYSPRLSVGDARAHVLKSLHLSGTLWDRLGFVPPGLWQVKGQTYMAYLEGDDRKLLLDGAPIGLDRHELRHACAERGIDILNKGDTELRGLLGDWLRLTAAEDGGERRRRMTALLLTRVENWPKAPNFPLPDLTL